MTWGQRGGCRRVEALSSRAWRWGLLGHRVLWWGQGTVPVHGDVHGQASGQRTRLSSFRACRLSQTVVTDLLPLEWQAGRQLPWGF